MALAELLTNLRTINQNYCIMDKEINEDVEKNEDLGSENNPVAEEKQELAANGDESEITRLKEELENTKDKYIRLYSEFENFRKRTAKEKLELIQSGNEQLIKNLLPVADDFERAENAFIDKSDPNLSGFFLIFSKFKKVLEIYGVKAMDSSTGSEFDADFHEAISQAPSPDPELKGKIIDVIEKGYLLNDKVIRYAKVVVGN